MTGIEDVSRHYTSGALLERIDAALRDGGADPGQISVDDLKPVDEFHTGGIEATTALLDQLDISPGTTVLDIGCGLGGPARYLAERFHCRVDGIDITAPFVEAANKLSALLGMDDVVVCRHGDGQKLPYGDQEFDGGYTQHVTMNVPDRDVFFGEAYRVLKPGAVFALTEHGLGEVGDPHHPVPWSEDGSGAYLMRPADTVAALRNAGFTNIEVTDTGEKYLQGYQAAIERAEKGDTPVFGTHILLGKLAPQIMRNAARNIEERRTHPLQIICYKPK